MKKTPFLFISLTLWLLAPHFVSAQDVTGKGDGDWAEWRGPLRTGEAAAGAAPPIEWSEQKNVLWKVEIPGSGTSTPIVSGNRVFLLSALSTGAKPEGAAVPPEPREQAQPQGRERGERRRRGGGRGASKPIETHQFIILCLDRTSGKTLWKQVAREELPHEGHHRDHGYASASPVTDGKHLYASFGSRGLYCYDLEGNKKWEKDFGDMKTRAGFGEGTSPALFGDTLVIKWDHEGDSFIVAVDKHSGKELWRKERDERTSWSTPLILEVDGKPQVITSATSKVIAYDLKSGDTVWESDDGLTDNVIPSPISADGMVYVMSGFRGNKLQAIRLGGKGKLSGTDAIVWTHESGTPYVPSPLLYQKHLYFFQGNDNRLSCFDAKTGAELFARKEIAGLRGIYASPVAAAGHIYLVGRQGNTVVIKAADKLEVLATNSLDEKFDASPAIVGNTLYLRGHKFLYCIGKSG